MRISTYIAVGVLSALAFSLQYLPASWVWSTLGGHVAPMIPAHVERVGGTVWNGYAVFRPHAMMGQQCVLDWDLNVIRLVTGNVAADIRIESRQFLAEGDVYGGIAGAGLEHFDINIDLQAIEPMLQPLGATASGTLQASQLKFALSPQWEVLQAEGHVNWHGGAVSYGYGGERYVIPPLKGVVSEREGGVYLSVTVAGSGLPLGEAGITKDGVGSLMVLQRVMTLVGMQGAEDDKVLIKTQQPLF